MGACYGQRQTISVIPLSQPREDECTNDIEASCNHISLIRKPILERLILKNQMKKMKLHVN